MNTYEITERETSTRIVTYQVDADSEEEAIELVENGFCNAIDAGEYEPFEWVIDEVRLIGEGE